VLLLTSANQDIYTERDAASTLLCSNSVLGTLTQPPIKEGDRRVIGT
jgi:hypothetical protein